MVKFQKAPRLSPGDTVAVLSQSSGLPHLFPHIYNQGVRNLEGAFHLKIQEYPTTRASPKELYRHPERRAEDLMRALKDPAVRGILMSIGGDDSIRVLPHLDRSAFRGPPKVIMGFSDSTTLLTNANLHGWVTFHGPSVMAGFSQMGSFPRAFQDHVRDILFSPRSPYEYRPYAKWSQGYLDWKDRGNTGRTKPRHLSEGWHWLQGKERRTGPLFGGCFELLVMLNGTPYWPFPSFWDGKILFMETSEERPPPSEVKYFLRTLGMQGVLDRIEALLLGRPRGYSRAQKAELERHVVGVVAEEFDHPELPIVSNLDFGHTDPQFILPLGVRAAVDPQRKTLALTEPAVR